MERLNPPGQLFIEPIRGHTGSVCLTRSDIERIIRRMCRRLLAALLIMGWVSLSCFDVIEDLDEIPGQAAFSAPDDGGTAKRGGWGPLANNSVESANHTERDDVTLISIAPNVFHSEPVPDFRRHSQLHKLHRVYLI